MLLACLVNAPPARGRKGVGQRLKLRFFRVIIIGSVVFCQITASAVGTDRLSVAAAQAAFERN